MVVNRYCRALALLLAFPPATFALGLGDIHLLSPLNAPLDAEIELVDVTPEELQSLKAQIASRDTFARYGLEWPVFLSSVQVRTVKNADGHEVIKLKSSDAITEPFITILVEVNWARGRLVREYTMLLDPPVYTPGQETPANAPVAAPAAGAGAKEGAIARPSGPPPAAESAPTTSNDGAAAPTTQDSSSPPPARSSGRSHSASASRQAAPSAPTASSQDGSHVVQRGETLSQIAASSSGGGPNSAQTRAWMLAIYQANPRAFEQNMNLLRSGAVLRIPESSAVSAISTSEANVEIRRQYAAWRSGAGTGAPSASEPGHLRLVTPSEAGAAGSSAQVQALQGRVKELEGQLTDSKRLLEMRNQELAQLQAKLAGEKAPPAAQTPPPAAATPPPAAAAPPAPPVEAPPPAPPETAQAPVEQTPPPAEATPPPAATTEPAKPPKHVTPVSEPASGGSILDTLKDYWWALGLLVVLILGAIGARAWRSRRESEFDDSLGRLAAAGAASVDRDTTGDTTPLRAPTGAGDAFLVEESGAHERPRFPGGAAPVPQPAKHVATDETVSSETAINLDQGDPLAEADFHMAYGLYDQAADLIRIAVTREPNRRDLKLKLLEVFFVWGNKEQFLQSARELADTRSEAAPGEWEKILIMGKQLAPEDPLFAGGGAVSGATAGGVDLDLEGGQSRVDFDLLGDPVPGQAASGEVDLDIGSALGDVSDSTTTQARAGATATDRNAAIDHNFTGATGTTRQMTARIASDATARIPAGDVEPMLPEFSTDSEAPTVEQPAFTGAGENPTIRQKVEIALKQGSPQSEQTAELAIDDLGLDLGALDTVDQPGLGSSPDAPTLVAGFDERSRKIMEDASRRASHDDKTAETAAWQIDEHELTAALDESEGQDGHDARHHADDTERDVSATSRLPPLSERDLDFDLGGHDDAHAETGPNVDLDVGSDIDLDVGTATVPDAAYTATQKLSSEDLALPDLEPVTMSEVGTKLDLARAYMDMGDPEGARNILEEVLHEGSVAQKQEAQRLLESLPG